MRIFQNSDQIFLDLYNNVFIVNIELKFCCYGRSYEYKELIDWLIYCERMQQEVTPGEIVHQYEYISFKKKIDKDEKK
jgi:hypothetical protein